MGNKNNKNDTSNDNGNNDVAQVSPGIKDANNTINDESQGAGNTEDKNIAGTSETLPDVNSQARDNSSAKLTVLNTGDFLVGTDIPKGRYVITGDGNGNLFINNKEGESYINEILGVGELGVENVTTDISDGDTIQISGIDNVTFTPAQTVLRTDTLTTGSWVVGVDFAPGRYDVSSTGGNGNFFVYNITGWPEVNEILGGGEIGVEKVTVDLKKGYMISISGMDEVRFTQK
jgi:hypothetical protein